MFRNFLSKLHPLRKRIAEQRLILAITGGLIVLVAVFGCAAQLPTHKPPVKSASYAAHTLATSSPAAVATPSATEVADEPTTSKPAPGPANQAQPKQPKALVISPSSFVIYKSGGYVQGLKPGIIDQIPVSIHANDGQAIKAPWSTDMFNYMTASSSDPAAYKSAWQFSANSSYASVGIHTITLITTSTNGTKYSGTIQITVKPLPVFTVSATYNVYGGEQRLHAADFRFGPLSIDTSRLSDDNLPTIEDQSADIVCDAQLEMLPDAIHCGSFSNPAPGRYTMNFVFENQFQRVVVAAYVDILPY